MSEESLINVSVSDNALLNIHLPDTPPSVDKAIENLSAPASYWGGLLGGSFTKAIYASIGLPCEAWANKKILQFKAASEAMQKRISAIPPENRIEPSFGVVRSISDGLELCIDEETLREGFVNLLGSAMDSRTANGLLKHHAQTLKLLCSDEAKILQVLSATRNYPVISIREKLTEGFNDCVPLFSTIGEKAGCSHALLVPSYLNHLETLGLAKIDWTTMLITDGVYKPLEESTIAKEALKYTESRGNTTDIRKGLITLTDLELNFVSSCGLTSTTNP